MIITFLVGSLFGLIGQIGSDAMSLISYIVSEDNLGKNGTGGDNILVGGSLGEAKGYLDTCVNGDGRIEQQLGLDGDQIKSFDDLYTSEDSINQAKENFTQKKQKETYNRLKGEIKKKKKFNINSSSF